MVFYVFVAFVGLNNNTIVYAQYRIWISLFCPIPRSGRKCQYRSDTDTEYRIGAPLMSHTRHICYSQTVKGTSCLSPANFWFYTNTIFFEIATDTETDIGSAAHT